MTTGSINPHEPPKIEVTIVGPNAPDESLQAAIAGHYDFANGEVTDEAWALTNGFKASFWGAASILILIQRVATWSILLVLGEHHLIWRVVVLTLVSGLTAPLNLGLTMMCVRRAAGLPATFSTAFSHFDKAGPAIAASLLASLVRRKTRVNRELAPGISGADNRRPNRQGNGVAMAPKPKPPSLAEHLAAAKELGYVLAQ